MFLDVLLYIKVKFKIEGDLVSGQKTFKRFLILDSNFFL